MKIPIQPPRARVSEFRYLVVFDFRSKPLTGAGQRAVPSILPGNYRTI